MTKFAPGLKIHDAKEYFQRGSAGVREWRTRHQGGIWAYVRDADLRGLDFTLCDFSMVDLCNADMRGCTFDGAIFQLSFLTEGNLEGASLATTQFKDSYIDRANIRNAFVSQTSFDNCTLVGTDFSGSTFVRAMIADCDLRSVVGLDAVKHNGPSSIGIDTILRSEGDIPRKFLEGCGLPDHIIEFVDAIAKKPIQYYSCFISHGEPDKDIAKHLHDKLQGAGVRCWFFQESARTGEPLFGEINKAIRLYDKLVIICSRDSLNREGVLHEIREGLQREKEEKLRHLKDEELVAHRKLGLEEFAKRVYRTQVLFPITIDDYIFDEWNSPYKTELTHRVVGDFRHWENFKEFDKQFKKLLADLQSKS